MVLSRFWLAIFISSIAFIVISLFTGNTYTIDYVLTRIRLVYGVDKKVLYEPRFG